ncbi:hypothetical protein JCM8208_006660 [Rhodotorula glutinis]
MASPSTSTAPPSASVDHLAHGIRALALKKWADACNHLALAVEHATSTHGDLAPENVEALVLYGKALLGSAIAQSAVLGGAAPQDNLSDALPASAAASSSAAARPSASTSNATAGPSNPKFHFGGDAEDDDGEGEGADGEGDGEGDEEGGEGEDGAPGADREDDLESAFQVLDMARAIVEKEVDKLESALEGAVKDEDKDKKDELDASRRIEKEKLADVHRLLGDVATESEQFEPAVTEYSAALSALSTVVEPHDRALSELHMLIALALDFVPNGTDRAVAHAEQAKAVLVLRLAELENAPEADRDDKVKREIDDIKGLLGDVDMKIEDLRTVPTAPAPTAADSALEAILRQSQGVVAQQQQSGSVNDLSGLVKRKKKAPEAAAVVVQEEVKVEAEDAKGGNEENVVKVVEGGVKKEEQAGEVDAAAPAPKRKAEDGEGGAEAKKAKVEQ